VDWSGLLDVSYTNLILYSEQFDRTPSPYWYIPEGAPILITANNAIDPGGGSTADTVNWYGSDSNYNRLIQFPISGIANSTKYTFSIWARLKSGADNRLCIYIGPGICSSFYSTSVWQRYSVTRTTDDNIVGTNSPYLDILHQGTSDFEFWGAQLEKGQYMNQNS